MARITVEDAVQYPFSCTEEIRITDINYGGHMGNDALLSILHHARIQFLKHYGYSELNIEGVSMIMADVGIEYKAEGFEGDVLRIEVGVGDRSSKGFDLVYRVSKTVEGREVVVAKAKTGILCFDYTARKVVSIPEGVKFLGE